MRAVATPPSFSMTIEHEPSAPTPRRLPERSGWHRVREWRLSAHEALFWARTLEETGRVWAGEVALGHGAALVEVRSRRRPYPLRVRVRTAQGCQRALERLTALSLDRCTWPSQEGGGEDA